jgi:CRISPR/Cas system-associated exonuclease Cas4 (RecB family)
VVTTKHKKWAPRSRAKTIYGAEGADDPFPLSRSKLDQFHKCPRCFWIDRVAGMAQPGIPGFALNSQVDELLKKEFDSHRSAGTPHPYMAENGLGHLVPLDHESMDDWRNNFKGVRTQKHGLVLFGSVDDIWCDPNEGGEWFVVDYKATSSSADMTAELFFEDIYKGSYVRQLAIYQWLLRELGAPVSSRGYFVYENGNKAVDSLMDGGPPEAPRGIPLKPVRVIEIDTADPNCIVEGVRIDMDWVESLVAGAKGCLDLPEPPEAGEFCEHCAYVDAVSKV